MQTIFIAIYDFFERRKVLFWICLGLVFGLSIAGALRIKLVDDVNKMIPQDRSVEAMNGVLNKTKTGEQIVFSFSFLDTARVNPDSLIVLQQQFQSGLADMDSNNIALIRARADENIEQRFSDLVLAYLPLFLTEEDYTQLAQMIRPENVRISLEKEQKLLLSPAGMVAKQWLASDPVGMIPLAFDKLKSLQFDPGYGLYDGYIFSADNRRMVFFLDLKQPASATSINALFFAKLDQYIMQWRKRVPALHITYFGGPAVAAANAQQLQRDTFLTLGLTIVLLSGLTFYVFKRKRIPLLLIIPVIFGALFGMAITAWIQTSVSVIALGAGAIILGIAVDFSIHFLSHARTHPDMRENVRTLVFPLTLGAITTIGAFWALRLASAPLLRDLGLFAAASLTGASLFTLIFLPHLLGAQFVRASLPLRQTVIDKIAQLQPEKSKWLLFFVIGITPVLGYFSLKVEFDSDLMHLNYLSPALQKAQEELNANNSFALGSVFIVAEDSSEEGVRRKLESADARADRLEAAGQIRKYSSPVLLLPSTEEQERRLARWQFFWQGGHDSQTLETVKREAERLGFSADAFSAFKTTLTRRYSFFDSTARHFLTGIMPNSFGGQGQAYYAVAYARVAPDARQEVINAFSDNEQVVVTDRQAVSERLLALLQSDFNTILLYSGLLVFLALLIAYGRIELALISFLPMALTWVWITGVMGILGLKFNIVNIIIATLIFGLGDDYSIFMMDGLMERYRTGKHKVSFARSAVYLSVLTTIAGLGTLAFAKHPALQSIAVVAIIGLLCVVFVSQVLQPFLFNFMVQRRADKGFMPFTLWSLLKSTFSFFYFFLGCLIVTLAGLVLLGFRPLGKRRSKYVFHVILSRYTGSVMYVMSNTTKKIVKPEGFNFNKPAVYIANHSSFLDILLTTMLHPKLVLLTNKWVWRSPVFGKIVRMAEYYPVAEGAEDSIEPLRDLVRRGYGIVVFPEGTRSYSDKIHRFHKGAFFIAEQLQLDIIPIIMHGVHYTMQKGDWLLKDGTVTLKILPAVKPDDPSFGNHYAERTKLVSRWFKQQFAAEKEKNEMPRYFKEQLVKGYIYKGPVLEWYCRIKIRMESYYEPFHQLFPRSGRFYDLGCGYGFMTYMLHWAAEGRLFVGVDYDEAKVVTAAHNYKRGKWSKEGQWTRFPEADKEDLSFSKPISFIHADVMQVALENCNGIIISDVLHYLLPEQQGVLLQKCFEALEPGGILILRDGVKELTQRHKGTRLTEWLSTKIVGFNKVQNKLHFISRNWLEDWAAERGITITTLDLTQKTSNLIFIMRKPMI